MLLTIYDKAGTKRADVAVNDSSTQSKEVQGDNVLSLSFSYYAFLPLDVNDYTDYLGERYWLTERYTPKQVSDGEWEYNLKLYGIESLIKRFLVLETTDGDTNPLFTLTATPREHVAMVVKAINNGMGHITDWKTGVTRNFAASLFRNIKYFTLRKLYLCRKWMQKRLQKTTTTGITLPNFDFLA